MTLMEVRNVSEGPAGYQGRVGRPSRRSGMGREAILEVRMTLPEVRNISEGLFGYTGRVGSLSGGVGRVRRPSWRSGTD